MCYCPEVWHEDLSLVSMQNMRKHSGGQSRMKEDKPDRNLFTWLLGMVFEMMCAFM